MDSVGRHIQLFLPMLWLGMVLAISFLEAPLKFRAPGVTLPLGLGIGRMVFRALNTVEAVLAVLLVLSCFAHRPDGAAIGWLVAAAVLLAVQLAVVRPILSKRSDRILAGADEPRSSAHFWYIGMEVAKVVTLVGLAFAAAP